MKSALDFIVIGAQKSGTTSLFHLLKDHPQLYLPEAKEIPFFSTGDYSPDQLTDFLKDFYARAPQHCLLGKVSPQYMAHPDAAARIAALFPDIRLIAILRDPVERAISHYRMLALRGRISLPIEQTLTRLMDPEWVDTARALPSGRDSEPQCLLVWGEYGRILARYREYFPKEQMLVLFTSELRSDPLKLLTRVWRFLQIQETVSPSRLGREFHVGGTKERFLWLGRLTRGRAKKLGKVLLPISVRKTLGFRLRQFNVLPDKAPEIALTEDLRRSLIDFYSRDTRQLEATFGLIAPWRETCERT